MTAIVVVAFFFFSSITAKKVTIAIVDTFFLMLKNFCGFVVTKKKKMTVFVTIFNLFGAKKMVMVTTFTFFGGIVVQKVTIAMSSLSSMVEVL